MRLETALEQLDLKEKRGQIYLACLELGAASVQDIARKAGIRRTTAYEILDGLLQEGLISVTTKGRTRIYVAERPAKLLENLEEREKKLKSFLPELESLYNVRATRPRVRFYEGLAGIKTVYEDTLTVKNKRLMGILSMQDLFQIPGRDYMTDYVTRRIKAGINLQVIRSESKEVEETWPSSAKELRELRCAPRGMEFAMTTYLYDHKVVLIGTQKENFGMIIESDDFLAVQKNLFETLWDVSRNTSKKD